MKSAKYIILAVLTLMAVGMQAEDNAAKWEKYGPTSKSTKAGFIVRAGYVIGGTTPLPPPATGRAAAKPSPCTEHRATTCSTSTSASPWASSSSSPA